LIANSNFTVLVLNCFRHEQTRRPG
jgi:hypothetical protein